MRNIIKFLVAVFLIFSSVAVYAFVFKGIIGNPKATEIKNHLDQKSQPFELSPERSRFLLTQNLSEHNSFALTKDQADAAYPDVGYYKGNYFIFFAPGISMIALPFYNVGLDFKLSQVFSFASVTLFALGNLVIIFLIARNMFSLPLWASFFASIIFGFASVSLGYATTLYQHHTTTFFLLSSFYAAWKYKQEGPLSILYASYIWIAYGLSIFVDYPNAILMLPIIVYFLLASVKVNHHIEVTQISIRAIIIATSIFFFTLVGIHGYYNYLNYGHPLRVSGSLIGYKTILDKHIPLDNNLDAAVEELQRAKNPVAYFRQDLIISGLYELLIAQDKGILIFSPIFILGFLGMLYALGRLNHEISTLIASILITILFYASWTDPWGGWAFGPRYLIPAIGGLAIFVSYYLSHTRLKLISKMLALILALYSMAVSLVGALTTNAVPPKPEADALHAKYGYLYTIDLLKQNMSSSVLFNTFFHNNMSLLTYFFLLASFLGIIILFILFIGPIIEKQKVEKSYD